MYHVSRKRKSEAAMRAGNVGWCGGGHVAGIFMVQGYLWFRDIYGAGMVMVVMMEGILADGVR